MHASCGKPSPRGFTAIELVIALALAAVITAILSSAYETFTVRRDVTAAIARARGLELAIESHYRRRGEVPGNRSDLSDDPGEAQSSHESLSVADGRIDLRFGDGAHAGLRGRSISLTPYETLERNIVWICGNRVPGVGLSPIGVLAGGREAVQIAATVEPRYLPRRCR